MVHGLETIVRLNQQLDKLHRKQKDRDVFLEMCHRRLTFGVPPLSLQEQRKLFLIATGIEIPDRQRCKACNCTGKVGCLRCSECKGAGYVGRDNG